MQAFHVRYRKPPHAHGFATIQAEDEFDAQLEAEARYGDDLIYVREHVPLTESESHDGIVRVAGRAPDWLRKIGLAVDAWMR